MRVKRLALSVLPVVLCALVCGAVMACAAYYFQRTGATLYYGDAEAHLDIARRIVDSRTPGWNQIGTTWLPLPHLLMIPFVRNDDWWKTGLAGAIPSAIAMALAGVFLFAAVQRVFENWIPAAVATAVFLLNPNTLYLGSIPMSEPCFFCAFFALLYFTVRFDATKGWGALIGAGIAASAASLTRYEGWFLIPFAALYVVVCGKGYLQRVAALVVFGILALIGPALWLAHNRYYFGDALYFYRGPWSAQAIQGNVGYPGRGDWHLAFRYFIEAGRLLAGWPALIIGAGGAIAALLRRAFWPVLLVVLLPLFYIWSIHSSSTPIFVPTLWPSSLTSPSFYNTRYAMAFLPLVAIGAAAIARFGKIPALAVLLAAFAPLALHPSQHSITWQESDVNSRARRQWTNEAAAWLRTATNPNDTYIAGFGDMTGVFRSLGIPLQSTLTGDNDWEYNAAIANPKLFLHSDWAVVTGGDSIQTVIDRVWFAGPRYELMHRVTVKGEPALEIYRRVQDPLPITDDENSVP